VVLAADYPFLEILGSMILFFAWVAWFWVLISIISDLFRRHDVSGWGKALWMLFVIVVPFLGVLVYLIAQGPHMAERNLEHAKAQQAQFDSYVRDVAAGPSGEIANAKKLLDAGTISEAEFESIKQKALA
jgi:uncharacterized membrane protein YcjF (UPF0283 family)